MHDVILRSVVLLLAATAAACSHEELARGSPVRDEPEPPTGLAPLRPEAGFVEVPDGPGADYTARLFYSLLPSERDADRAPLLVLFNGGPGSATTAWLMPFGTGPSTLRADAPDSVPATNAASWTEFANLLYIDARMAGFSYGRGELECAGDAPPNWQDWIVPDAADFVYVLLDVLERHEALRDNPVVLVGESYGGARGALMLHMLQRHESLDPFVHESVPWLRARVRAHWELRSPEVAGPVTPEVASQQFAGAVFIQPSFWSANEWALMDSAAQEEPDLADYFAESPADMDPFHVHRPLWQSEAIESVVAGAMRDPDALSAFLQQDVREVEGLRAATRAGGRRVFSWPGLNEESALGEVEMQAKLGALGPTDAYWLPFSLVCDAWWVNSVPDDRFVEMFADALPRSHVLITHARWDSVVYTKALPEVLSGVLPPGHQVQIDPTSPKGTARPGIMAVTRDADVVARIRFPTYDAGHAVTLDQGAQLGADIREWLEQTGIVHAQ